jgi:CDP-diacylglycerol--serine O-phosphatidyltransferase
VPDDVRGLRPRRQRGARAQDQIVELKDVATLGALAVALYAVEQAFAGHIERAAVLVLLGWGFDAIDGLIARLTHSGNAFGSHLDDIVDLIAYTVAPAFVLFNAYVPHGRTVAFLLLFTVVAIGTIRLARFAAAPLSYPGYWIGLPRPAFGFMLVFFVNSSLFATPRGWLVGMLMVAVLAVLSLTRLPYRNHKRPFKRWQAAALVAILLGGIALYPLGQMWNGALMLGALYLFAPWISVSRDERARIAQALTGGTAGDAGETP